MKKLFALVALMFLPAFAEAQLVMGGRAAGVAVNGFSACRPYRADHTRVPNTVLPAVDLSNFPAIFDSIVLPELMNDLRTVANGGLVTSDRAYDVLIFPDALGGAGGDKFDHEIDYYNPVTGRLIIHFRQTMSAFVDVLDYACFGKSSITTSQESITAVWNAGYRAVWHCRVPPPIKGEASQYLDSTSYAISNVSGPGTPGVTGKIGTACTFSPGVPINYGNNSLLNLGDFTYEFWYHLNTSSGGVLFSKYSTGEHEGIRVHITENAGSFDASLAGQSGIMVHINASVSGQVFALAGPAPRAGDTKHVQVSWSRPIGYIYIDGELVTTFNYYPAAAGAPLTDGLLGDVYGWIDEARIHSVRRPHDYLRLSYLMQSNPAIIWSSGPRI